MAVDANVLIFSRIREEICATACRPRWPFTRAFERAVATILDANITTLIVAVILYAVGTGPVKGFAVTLSVGIVTSMFTAIMGTRALVNLIYGRPACAGTCHRRWSRESRHENHNFMGQRKLGDGAVRHPAGSVSIGSLAVKQLNWGLDFTGGTLVEVHYSRDRRTSTRSGSTLEQRRAIEGAVVVSFGTDQDVLIRLPEGYSDEQGAALLVQVLQEAIMPAGVELRRIEFVGPQVGDELREQGGLAMLLALGLVMLYIAFRFQFKFAVGRGGGPGTRRARQSWAFSR